MKTRDEILSTMAPELRSSLNSIIAHADILDAEIYGPLNEQQHKSIRSIIDDSQYLSGLIDDFLFFSNVADGKFIPQPVVVWVADFCQNSIRLARESAYKRSINLKTEYDNQVEGIVTDERILKCILVKLLNHAIHSTPECGNVTLIVKGNRSVETVKFSIENYWSASFAKNSTRQPKSFPDIENEADLETMLVRRLVELQGGKIEVEKRSESGSMVTITFPWILPQTKSRKD